MNAKQKLTLINANFPKEATLDYLLGRVISFEFENFKRKLLITDATYDDITKTVTISFYSCFINKKKGLVGLILDENGWIYVLTTKQIGLRGDVQYESEAIQLFSFS